MVAVLILLTLVGGAAVIGLLALIGFQVWEYVMKRVQHKDSWEDEQARYAQAQAREMQRVQTEAWAAAQREANGKS